MAKPSARVVVPAILLALLLVQPCLSTELVVVEKPAPSGNFPIPYAGCVTGSRLVHLGADGSQSVLTPDFVGACGPSVSFDGRELLFAGQKSVTGSWQVWRMELGTGNAVQITDRPGNAFAPVWVGALFHLDDEIPTRRIAYLATGTTKRRTPALYISNLDGSDELRISFTPEGVLAPDVLPNGRIVYPAFGRPDGSGTSLMGLNIDGTDLAVFADPHDSPRYPHAVRAGSDGKVYFVEAVGEALHGGALASVSLRRPLRSRKVIANTEAGLFLDPAPMSDGSLLASFTGRESGIYELVRLDPETGRIIETVHRSEEFHVLDAHELAPRPMVPGRSTVVDTNKDTGVFFCLSSHITDRPSLLHLRDGGASRLRVIEYHKQDDPPMTERVLGEVQVESDGSFHIEVPAQTPLRFQLLDAEGIILGEQCSWTWVMPREWRGCIGCHEDREMVAPNILAEAVVKPAVQLQHSHGESTKGNTP